MEISRDTDYRSAGFAGELGFGQRPAVIVIDMMMAYFERTSPMYAGVEGALESTIRIVKVAYERGVPVFFTRQFYRPGDVNEVYPRKVPALKLLAPEAPLTVLAPSLPTEGGTVFVKRYPSAFHETDLAVRLAGLGVDTLIITGLTTSGCVRATAMDTLLNGYVGVVVREAVGDRNQAQHEANLFDINAKLADVRSEAEVLSWLRRSAPGAAGGS